MNSDNIMDMQSWFYKRENLYSFFGCDNTTFVSVEVTPHWDLIVETKSRKYYCHFLPEFSHQVDVVHLVNSILKKPIYSHHLQDLGRGERVLIVDRVASNISPDVVFFLNALLNKQNIALRHMKDYQPKKVTFQGSSEETSNVKTQGKEKEKENGQISLSISESFNSDVDMDIGGDTANMAMLEADVVMNNAKIARLESDVLRLQTELQELRNDLLEDFHTSLQSAILEKVRQEVDKKWMSI